MSALGSALLVPVLAALALGCEPPRVAASAADRELDGVDTSSLTGPERTSWSMLVDQELAPCKELVLSLRECVERRAPCPGCVSGARFLAARLGRGDATSQAEQAYRVRFGAEGVKSVALDDSPQRGPANASITIVEWADYECPFCANTATLLDDLLSRRPDQVRLVFKHFPIASHPRARLAAQAAAAAQEQGKFWEMHRLLFSGKSHQLSPERLPDLARELGLDVPRFVTDFGSAKVADRIERDQKQADLLGLRGTPFVLINGRHFDASHFDLEEDLDAWIDLELELLGRSGGAR
jgi:protein-disulfide isomerase